jgi:hypothetical protein
MLERGELRFRRRRVWIDGIRVTPRRVDGKAIEQPARRRNTDAGEKSDRAFRPKKRLRRRLPKEYYPLTLFLAFFLKKLLILSEDVVQFGRGGI